jgi:hypothetical protein
VVGGTCCGHNCTACLSGNCCFPQGDDTRLKPVPASNERNSDSKDYPKQGEQKYEKSKR